ncbi:MAG: zf-TFIIB domain-containing protein [Polyangiaceae bacterium]
MSPLPVLTMCPQCKDPLVTITHDEISALACRGCGGAWIETDTMTRVTYALDPSSIAVGDEAGSMARLAFPPHSAAPPCPVCHASMSTLTLNGTDVEVDVCNEHGTWFDRGELQTVIRELMARDHAEDAPSDFRVSESRSPGAAAPHPITSEELRAQMIAQYGVDPSVRSPYNDGSPSDYDTAANIGISILGFLLR